MSEERVNGRAANDSASARGAGNPAAQAVDSAAGEPGTAPGRAESAVPPEAPRPNLYVERLLTIGMAACGAWTLARALAAAGLSSPHAASVGVLVVAIFATGITLAGQGESSRYRRYSEFGLTDWLLLLIPILVLLKLLPRVFEGPAALGAEVASWIDDPAHFFDVTLIWSLVLVFLVWDYAVRVAEDLNKLSLQPGEIPPAVNSPAYYEWLASAYRFVDHRAAWRRLMASFTWGGFVVLLLTGVTLVHPDQLANPDRPEVLGAIPAVLLYYLFGLLLASQSSLDRLRTEWLRSGAEVQPGLARRWLAFGGALVLVSLALALLLPTSFSDRAADQLPLIWRWLWPLRFTFGALLWAIDWLIAHVVALLLAPLVWLLPHATPKDTAAPLGPPAFPTPMPAPPPGAAFPSAASRIAWGLLFYGVPAAITAYAAWNIWRKRSGLIAGLRAAVRDLWTLLRDAALDLLATLWRLFGAASPRFLALAPQSIRSRWRKRARRVTGEGGGMGWLRLRGLSPRQLVQYFYVSLTQRAGAVGWERGRGQTPYEFSRSLAARLPEQQAELAELTEAYVRARYSRRDVTEADARRVRRPWERLRGTLQTRRRARQVGAWFGLNREQA